MIALTVIIAAAAAFLIGMAVGRRTGQSRTGINHFEMARSLERLLEADSHYPVLPPNFREPVTELLDQFWKHPPSIDPRDQPRKPLY